MLVLAAEALPPSVARACVDSLLHWVAEYCSLPSHCLVFGLSNPTWTTLLVVQLGCQQNLRCSGWSIVLVWLSVAGHWPHSMARLVPQLVCLQDPCACTTFDTRVAYSSLVLNLLLSYPCCVVQPCFELVIVCPPTPALPQCSLGPCLVARAPAAASGCCTFHLPDCQLQVTPASAPVNICFHDVHTQHWPGVLSTCMPQAVQMLIYGPKPIQTLTPERLPLLVGMQWGS